MLKRSVFKEAGIDIGSSSVGVVINFLVVTCENVLLNALVGADIIAIIRMEFTLSNVVNFLDTVRRDEELTRPLNSLLPSTVGPSKQSSPPVKPPIPSNRISPMSTMISAIRCDTCRFSFSVKWFQQELKGSPLRYSSAMKASGRPGANA